VNNIGALLKVIIIFSLGIGGIVFAIRHGAANTISASSFLPSFGVAKQFLPVIVFLLLDSSSSRAWRRGPGAGEAHPARDLHLRATIAFLYLFATIGSCSLSHSAS